MRRLPPLNALKAFEAAARLGSMQAAAGELKVTPAAISQQVRALERYLDMPLFQRVVRGLVLTDEGEVYLHEARHALDRLGSATEQLMDRRIAGVLRVSVIPSLANRWLVQRLADFLEHYPHVTLRLIEDVRPIDFNRDRFEMALRYGAGDYGGLRADRLMGEQLELVAASKLLPDPQSRRDARKLAHCTLLHEAAERLGEPWSHWQPWLDALGVARDAAADRGPRFNATATLLEAAEAGAGVAIGRTRLIERELAAGRLVRVFGDSRPSRLAYWTVSPPGVAMLPRVAAFREWLQRQAAASEPAVDARASDAAGADRGGP